ncbi:hypothetical protein DL96DRAFT_417924 [Flagelloscypha sp. PMI_526]|nr:hypothetical protein DL96DRAFT_417924 [Flagelloscypha sp. PMI_526]
MPDSIRLSPVMGHVWAFDALQLFGAILFLILVITAVLSRGRIHRTGAWYSFCLSWTLSGISYTLLFIGGFHTRPRAGDEEGTVGFRLCAFQAALMYSVPILGSAASLALVGSIYLDIRTVVSYTISRGPAVGNWALIAMPYVFFIAAFIGYFTNAMANPSIVSADSSQGVYCTLNGSEHSKVTALITAVLTFISIVGEAVIITKLRRNQGMIKNGVVSMQLVVGLLVFSLLAVTVLVASLVLVLGKYNVVLFNILLALLPAVGSIIFALQRVRVLSSSARYLPNLVSIRISSKHGGYYHTHQNTIHP